MGRTNAARRELNDIKRLDSDLARVRRSEMPFVTVGAFHYAKLTGQRSVGIPKENGTTFFDLTGSTNRNGSCHFKLVFQIP